MKFHIKNYNIFKNYGSNYFNNKVCFNIPSPKIIYNI